MDSIWSGHPLVPDENHRRGQLFNLTKCSGFSWYERLLPCTAACLCCEERIVKTCEGAEEGSTEVEVCSSQTVSVRKLMTFLPLEQSAVGVELHPPEHVAAGTVTPAETLV